MNELHLSGMFQLLFANEKSFIFLIQFFDSFPNLGAESFTPLDVNCYRLFEIGISILCGLWSFFCDGILRSSVSLFIIDVFSENKVRIHLFYTWKNVHDFKDFLRRFKYVPYWSKWKKINLFLLISYFSTAITQINIIKQQNLWKFYSSQILLKNNKNPNCDLKALAPHWSLKGTSYAVLSR